MNENNNTTPRSFTKISTETDSAIFFSANAMLSVRFIDADALTIMIRPAVYNESGQRKFPKKDGPDAIKYSIRLRRDQVAAWLEKIETGFVPKFVEYVDSFIDDPTFNKTCSRGIMVYGKESNRIVDIFSGQPTEKGYEPSLRIISDLNSENIAGTIIEYKFESAPVITDYNPATGEFQLSNTYPQLIIFKRVLNAFIEASTFGTSHAINMAFRERLSNITENVNQLCIKNGITPRMPAYLTNQNQPQSATYKPNVNAIAAQAQAPVAMTEMTMNDMLDGGFPY